MGDQVPNFRLTFLCSPDQILERAFNRAEYASVELPPAIIDLWLSSRVWDVHCSDSASTFVVVKHWANQRDPFGGVNTRYRRVSPGKSIMSSSGLTE
jgi:hypothetical protein